MAISRRQVLGGILASAAAAACGKRASTPARTDRIVAPKPRALVVILLRGGVDAVLSTDPKRSTEVDQFVNVPYGPGDIFEVNGHRFGPHLKPMAAALGSFAIVNNVHVGTVRHETGEPQINRLRTKVSEETPTAADVIGWYRQGPALGAVALGGRMIAPFSPGMLECTTRRIQSAEDRDLCDLMMELPPEELHKSAEALDHLVATSADSPEVVRHSRDMAAFMRKLATVPPFKEEEWAPETDPDARLFFGVPRTKWMSRDFQKTLWMLEHELTATVNLGCRELEWDSHIDNLPWQTKMNAAYFPLLARFMQELQTRKNRHGTLASQTMIVMGSELGRNPRLNDHKGKDHFPETPLFFAGPNVKTNGSNGAVYGTTGRRMEALPLSLETGRPDARGTIVGLDDIGASVMAAFGIPAAAHGYTGRTLPFLVDV
jgi:hypothetical protein